MLSRNQLRIASFTAQGLSGIQVANIIGTSPSYVSQELSNEEVQAEVERLRQAALDEPASIEKIEEEALQTKYLETENKLLKRIGEDMEFAEFPQLVRALEVVAGRQEKRADRLAKLRMPAPTHNTQVAVLVLPAAQQQRLALDASRLQLNSQKEIVGVGDQSLSGMTAAAVKALFSTEDTQPLALAHDF